MSCWRHYIKVIDNVWRYEDTLSRWNGNELGNNLCRQHIEDAFSNSRPIRLVLAVTDETVHVDSGDDASKVKKEFFTQRDRVGRVVHYDGDKFIIEFKKCAVWNFGDVVS